MNDIQKGFVHLLLVVTIFFVTIGTLLYFVFTNNKNSETFQKTLDLESITASESNGKVITPDPTKTYSNEITWVNHSNTNRGISFKHPEGWEIVYALMGENTEIDIKNPKKDTLVLITILSDKKLESESSIRKAVSEREEDIRSNENYKVSDFRSLVQGNIGNYVASGEEQYFVFEEDKELGQLDVATYKFQEKGLYEINNKTVIFHGMTLKDQNEDVITQIVESFELK